MRTLTFRITNQEEIGGQIAYYQRRYSSCFRSAYEQGYAGSKYSKELIAGLVSDHGLPSWLAYCAFLDSDGQVQAHKSQEDTGQRTQKVIWGGRNNFLKRAQGLISKNEFKKARLRPMMLVGERPQNSNRLFNFDLKNLAVEFKPDRKTKIRIEFTSISKKWINEIKALRVYVGQIPISIRLSETEIQFCFQEQLRTFDFETGEVLDPHKFVHGRVLGVDLNPNSIGVSVPALNQHFSYHFDLKKSTRKDLTQNKRKHETIQIAHSIIKHMVSQHIGVIAIEKLNMKPGDTGNGARFNRLVNTDWKKTLFINKIKHLAAVHGIQVIEVPPQYSSFVGAIHGGLPDPICAAQEIAERGRRKIQGLNGADLLFPGKSIRSRLI